MKNEYRSDYGGPWQIQRSAERYRDIIKGKVKDDLGRVVSDPGMIGKQGDKLVRIPVPQIELPHFRFTDGQGGVGMGEGDQGDKAGDQPGDHMEEVEFTIDELTAMIEDMIELPNLLPLTGELIDYYWKMRGITTAPSIRLAVKRSYLEGLKAYGDPVKAMTMIQSKGIRRFRSFKKEERPTTRAKLVFMRDVSGSMYGERKEISRMMADWMERILKRHYQSVETVHIVHDTQAAIVDKDQFYSLEISGGTKISSAYTLLKRLIEESPGWNIFPVHLTDCENYDSADNSLCVSLIDEMLQQPWVRLFAVADVSLNTREEPFYKIVSGQTEQLADQSLGRMTTTKPLGREDVLESILDIFGRKEDEIQY